VPVLSIYATHSLEVAPDSGSTVLELAAGSLQTIEDPAAALVSMVTEPEVPPNRVMVPAVVLAVPSDNPPPDIVALESPEIVFPVMA
jgi:hypothetical protein